MTKTTVFNQNQTVIAYLRKNRKRKLTTYQITEGVNEGLSKNLRLTPTQISKCLNRFSEKDMVKKIDSKGTHPKTGRTANRWTYVSA
jgi:hypothetical protein